MLQLEFMTQVAVIDTACINSTWTLKAPNKYEALMSNEELN
jgi:hypothetical protein